MPFRYVLSRPIGLLGPICPFGAYLPSTDEGGYAWPHEARLLIKAHRAIRLRAPKRTKKGADADVEILPRPAARGHCPRRPRVGLYDTPGMSGGYPCGLYGPIATSMRDAGCECALACCREAGHSLRLG